MSKVITQLEMEKYAGTKQVCFPEDVIITPAARDWAKAHQIEIVCADKAADPPVVDQHTATAMDRDDLLTQVILAVQSRLTREGLPLNKDQVTEAVVLCLEKMGYEII